MGYCVLAIQYKRLAISLLVMPIIYVKLDYFAIEIPSWSQVALVSMLTCQTQIRRRACLPVSLNIYCKVLLQQGVRKLAFGKKILFCIALSMPTLPCKTVDFPKASQDKVLFILTMTLVLRQHSQKCTNTPQNCDVPSLCYTKGSGRWELSGAFRQK